MFAFFLILFFVPMCAAGVAFLLLHGITPKEFGLVGGVVFVIAGASAGIVSWSKTSDEEIWNGVIQRKASEQVKCSHSYQCDCKIKCSKNKDGKEDCKNVCKTCYEHPKDWDWNLYTSNNETIRIARTDRQGLAEPPRWSAALIGEPTALSRSYTNYIKGAPEAIFQDLSPPAEYAASLPAYPIKVYDYHRVDRLVTVGFAAHDSNEWNRELSRINGALGAAKQVNMLVVLVQGYPIEWFEALEEHWLGGKKNDVVLVVGVNADLSLRWVEVMAWTTNERFKQELRLAVGALPLLTREALLQTLYEKVQQSYQRKPMKDFEYLKSMMTPSVFQWVLTLLLSLAATAWMLWFFERQNLLDERRTKPHEVRRAALRWLRAKNPLRRGPLPEDPPDA